MQFIKTVNSYSRTDSLLVVSYVNLLKVARGALKMSLLYVNDLPPSGPPTAEGKIAIVRLAAACKSCGIKATECGANLYVGLPSERARRSNPRRGNHTVHSNTP